VLPKTFLHFRALAQKPKSEKVNASFCTFDQNINIEKMENDGTKRSNIKIGIEVEIVQKQDQRTGSLTEGFVKRILTNSANHHHGIKVMLETGEVGRVKNILD